MFLKLFRLHSIEASESIKNPGWVSAMVHLINSKKSKYFRWHDSGDVQDLDHLNKIFKVCELDARRQALAANA